MLVSTNGPPMHLWNSSAALTEWVQKHMSALDNKTRNCKKITINDLNSLEKIFKQMFCTAKL